MEEIDEAAGGGGGGAPHGSSRRNQHMKKGSLKNKALSISFDEKDLQDYVTGFHKRKKKRRKEANQKLEEAHRRKRIEARKKRKLEKEFVQYGGALPDTSAGPVEGDEPEQYVKESEIVPSVSGTMTYDNVDMKVTVTTSAISPEEEDTPSERPNADTFTSKGADVKKPRMPLVKKKPLKKVARPKTRKKPQSKRDKHKKKNQLL